MGTGAIGPGEDVEAWCTRCRMNLNHRVIAVVGRSIQRVHCLTCGGDHKYYPPKYEKGAEKGKRTVRVSSSSTGEKGRKAVGIRAADKALGEWTTFMNEMPPGTVPRAYRITEVYGLSEFIEHPTLGTGRVVDILGQEKIEVIFKDGRKVLVCNRSR